MAAGPSAALNVPDQVRLEAELVPRHWVMDRLETWLGEEDSRIFLMTGPPGAGKTSLIAQFVLRHDGGEPSTNHPRLSSAVVALAYFCDASNERTLDPLDFVRALSNGLAQRVPGFAQALASSAAGTSAIVSINSSQTIGQVQPGASVTNVNISVPRDIPTRQAFAHLVRRPLEVAVGSGWDQQLLILVDDLSGGYQYDSEDNIARLIGVVADNPEELPGYLRFWVTSRPDPWVLRDLPPPSVDLLADQPAQQDDIRLYIHQRLSRLEQPLRREWTEQVATIADGNFLYARHVVDHLLSNKQILSSGPANYELPTSLLDLYRQWFKTGIARHKDLWWNCIQPVLTTLTVARGAGLRPEQIAGITGLASSKVRRALEECAQYLIGMLPDGPMRLYHHSFRDFLATEEISREEGDRAVFDFFMRQHRDSWLEADDYACEHLATHAADIGELPTLLGHPDFLVVAEPTALMYQLSRLAEDRQPDAEIYRRVSWLLADRDHSERAAYLELAADEIGDLRLAGEFARLPLHRGWAPRWVSLMRHYPSRVVGGNPGGVLDMLSAELADIGAIVATVSSDGALRIWELESYRLRHTVSLDAMAAANLTLIPTEESALLVVASPRHVWLVDPYRGAVVDSLTGRPDAPITGVAVALAGDRNVLVLGYDDGVLEAREPETGRTVGGQINAHQGPVVSLVSTRSDAVLSGGVDGKAIIWFLDASGLAEATGSIDGGDGWAGACAFSWNEGDWVMCAGFSDGVINWFQNLGGRQQWYSSAAHQPAAWRYGYYALAADGSASATSTNTYGNPAGDITYETVLREHRRGEQERKEEELGEAGEEQERVKQDAVTSPTHIVQLSGGVNAVDLLVSDGRALMASGGEDGYVQLFDLGAEPPTQDILMPLGQPVSAVQFATVGTNTVLLTAESGGGGAIRGWSLQPGTSPLPGLVGDLDAPVIHFDTATSQDGNPLIAYALADGTVVLRDAESGQVVAGPLDGIDFALNGVHLCRWGGVVVVIAFGRELVRETRRPRGVVRLWQMRSSTIAASHSIKFEELADVTAVDNFEERAEIIVAGAPQDDNGEVLWLVTKRGNEWLPTRVGAGGDMFLGRATSPDSLAVMTGTDGRKVLIGQYGQINALLSLDTMTIRQLGPGTIRLVRYKGTSATVTSLSSSVFLEKLDSDVENVELFFEGTQGHDVSAIAALDDAKLVAAGIVDGRVVIWHADGPPDQAIQLGSPPRQIAICGDETLVLRTDLGLLSLRIRPIKNC